MLLRNTRHVVRTVAVAMVAMTVAAMSWADLLGDTSTSTDASQETQAFCQPTDPPRQPPADPMLVTADCVDPRYNNPVVEVDVVRTTPILHRFISGRFDGTPARFGFYFPLEDPLNPAAFEYGQRFYQGPTHQLRLTGEIASDREIEHAAGSGAYLVLSNPYQDYALTARDAIGGWGHPDSVGYRVDAAAAKFSREMAAEVYGFPHRPFGYVYGGSGGAYQTHTKAEHTEGVWDGFLPFVMGHPLAIPNNMSMRLHPKRVLDLRNKFPCIVDVVDAGGSGDPIGSCDLNEEEAGAYLEALHYGFPPRSWYRHPTITTGPLFLVAAYVPLLDPNYADDFWNTPGYLGYDATVGTQPGSIADARIVHPTSVVAASPPVPHASPDEDAEITYDSLGPTYNSYMLSQYITGPLREVTLASLPDGDLVGAALVIETGPAAGEFVIIGQVVRETNTITFGGGQDPAVVNAIEVGDQVRVDNSFSLGLQTYHRHQVTDKFGELKSWTQFRQGRRGTTRFPQRDVLPGEVGAFNSSGAVNTGRIREGNKVIVVQNMMDIEAMPINAQWYQTRVQEHLGKNTDKQFRLWYTDHARHSGVGDDLTREVQYRGVLDQALRDLSAWVERGVEPPANTSYEVVDGAQIQVPATAAERGGIQPVVHLMANGAERAEVKVGEAVTFTATIEVPPGTGSVIAAEWDLNSDDGDHYPAGDQPGNAFGPAPTVSVSHTHTYTEPGTYFVTVRGTSQREADTDTPWARVENLDRARVVVSE